VQFQRISISSPRKVNRNYMGKGDSKAKLFKGNYEAKLKFSSGGDSN